jgi:hypothetical protein
VGNLKQAIEYLINEQLKMKDEFYVAKQQQKDFIENYREE